MTATTTAATAGNRIQKVLHFYDAPIGKKVVMAVTGAILFGFVFVHMAGNLQIFGGQEVFDNYARLLRVEPGLLWLARAILLISVVMHIVAALQLSALKQQARPVGYQKKQNVGSSWAARTMIWSGILIAAFVVYHILNLTLGAVGLPFQEGHVFENTVATFRVIPISIAYIVAMIFLGFHLNHGVWSMFQSLGVSDPRRLAAARRFANIFSILVVLGFIAIPIAVMAGYGS